METVELLGVRFHPLTRPQLFEIVARSIKAEQKITIAHVNVHAMNLAHKLTWYRDFLNQADIVFCDGAGIMLGARILNYHVPERITYADWMWELAIFGQAHDFTFFFLGARPGIAKQAARRLQEYFPDLLIAGTHHGYFDKTPGHPENEKVIEYINAVQPNILVVGFGMPLQEQWLMKNRTRLKVNVALTGGATFDYVSGELQRGPSWMTDNGLEWLARLVIEPRRLWRRYLIGNPLFLYRVLKQRLRYK